MIDRLKNLPPQFKKILKISSQLADHLNCRLYLVGGVVRDLILGHQVFDLDIVVEGDAIEFSRKLAEEIKGDFSKHHAFGTAQVCFDGHKIDLATARSEEYSHWGALPKVKPASLAQDLKRRDFTINAMAISLNKDDYGKLIDLYKGLSDLKNGILRVLHEKSFLEDPTRILRAIRFEQRFGFKMESYTFSLLREALNLKALKFVNSHRLRDELILILKEPKPYAYIKRIKELEGFSFIDRKIKLNKENFKFFLRAQAAISHYQKRFKKHRKLQTWLIFLAGILINLSSQRLEKVLHNFGFRKGERLIISSIKKNVRKIKKLNKCTNPQIIYRTLNPYSFESILFFYAYYSKKVFRKNIRYFLDKLVDTRLRIRGKDLEDLGLKPSTIYSKIFKKLLYSKMDNRLKSRREELEEAKRIYKRLSKSSS